MPPRKRPGEKKPGQSKPSKSREKSPKSGAGGAKATESAAPEAATREEATRAATTGGATTPPEEQICYSLRYPDRYVEGQLASEIGIRIVGRPANGSPITPSRETGGRFPKVIWVDAGDTVLAHLDSIQVKLLDQTIIASIDMECDQTGRVTMVCVFVTGSGSDPAGLVCVTDETPRGNATMAARWGQQILSALWSALLGLVGDHAKERNMEPLGLIASPGVLQLFAGAPVAIGSAISDEKETER